MSNETEQEKKLVIIEMDDGLVQEITSNIPGLEVVIIDSDTESAAEEDIVKLENSAGKEYECVLAHWTDIHENQDWADTVYAAVRRRYETAEAFEESN